TWCFGCHLLARAVCMRWLPCGLGHSKVRSRLGAQLMNELDAYYRNLMADVRREADASGVLMVEAFFDQMSARLAEAGEIETADRAFYESGDGTRRIRIDGYAGDPRDGEGVLGLIVCDFTEGDEPLPFGKADIPPILNPLVRFLK